MHRPGRCVCCCKSLGGLSAILLLLFSGATGTARADIFHLKTGGTVSGQLVDRADEHFRIRTTGGLVRIPASAVESIEAAPTPFDEYDQRVQAAADTAQDQTALAEWCDEQGLRAERRKHLQRAIELDPDYSPARLALGYVRVGVLWVDGRHVAARARGTAAPEDVRSDPERLARAIQSQWYLQIRALKQSLLDSAVERLVQQGRRRILEIKDPLAILPLAQILSTGDTACRALLGRALAQFPEDEATMNLAVLALADSDADNRHQALAELARREDSRVITRYLETLRHGSDLMVARAAAGLGDLGATEALPDLIAALTVRRHKWVELPVPWHFVQWPLVFTSGTVVHLGVDTSAVHAPEIGVQCGPYGCGPIWADPGWQLQYVTVYRTEVLEALKRLTGQNFGFERERWRRWYAENSS